MLSASWLSGPVDLMYSSRFPLALFPVSRRMASVRYSFFPFTRNRALYASIDMVRVLRVMVGVGRPRMHNTHVYASRKSELLSAGFLVILFEGEFKAVDFEGGRWKKGWNNVPDETSPLWAFLRNLGPKEA